MKTLTFFKSMMPCTALRVSLMTMILIAHEGAFASASSSSSSSPLRADSPSEAGTPSIPIESLPLVQEASDIDLSSGSVLRTLGSFKINSWTLPPLTRLDQSMNALGARELMEPIPSRDDYFNALAGKYERGERGALPVKRQEVRVETFLPLGFDVSRTYKTLVYSPGSGGLCKSERTLLTRLADELDVMGFGVESNLSRDVNGNGSSAENQLNQNHLNLAQDVLRMAEILEGHPNVKGLAAAGSSLGAVALTALADRSLSGPMYARSLFLKGGLTDASNRWINASPFQALFLLTPIFPVQFASSSMPSGLHMSLILGAYDMWCEPFSALRAVLRTHGSMSMHLLKMGHGPECDRGEWDERIRRHSDKLSKLTHDGTELIHCKKGENISRCTTVMTPFWAMAFFNVPGLRAPTDEDMPILGQMASAPMKALGPHEAADQDLPMGLDGLGAIMGRTTKGTLLEPNEDAVTKIIDKMRGDLATYVTGEPWDERVWSASLHATEGAKALARSASRAFEGEAGQRLHAIAMGILARPEREATAAELLEMRACYARILGPLAEDVS